MRKYDHLERLDHQNVDGIDMGTVHIFPKLDGTNVRVWPTYGERGVVAGSRNRVLDKDDDHFGFNKWVQSQTTFFIGLTWPLRHLGNCGDFIFYGEWLTPHTLKTYRKDAWNRFYLFDVFHLGEGRYLSYDEYFDKLAPHASGQFCVVPCMVTAINPTRAQLDGQLEKNLHLIQDGCGVGEGIVLKNYDWRNSNGEQIWAKLVRNEFKEQNKLAFGSPKIGEAVQYEALIAEECVTRTLVLKEQAKLRHLDRHILIPRLLSTVFYCLVNEELWTALKKHKFPTVDFKRLRKFCAIKTKEHAKDLF